MSFHHRLTLHFTIGELRKEGFKCDERDSTEPASQITLSQIGAFARRELTDGNKLTRPILRFFNQPYLVSSKNPIREEICIMSITDKLRTSTVSFRGRKHFYHRFRHRRMHAPVEFVDNE